MLKAETIARLKELARAQPWDEHEDGEDVVIDDFAGGNVDDAFDGGMRAGETYLAREILTELDISWE